jgi:hypothetical protein
MRKAKARVVHRTGEAAALPPELAQSAAAMGAMSAGAAPVGSAKMTRLEGSDAAAFAAAALGGAHLEAGPAPARAGGRKAADETKRPVRPRVVRRKRK